MPSILVKTMMGLGDTIYQRSVLRHLTGDAYVETAWPELYADLGVRCVKAVTALRTQRKSATSSHYSWWKTPPDAPVLYIHYNPVTLPGSNIQALLAKAARINEPPVMDLPSLPPAPLALDRPYAVVRPSTLRREWLNPARAPASAYLAQAAAVLRDRGYFVVSVADLAPGEEWLEPPEPPADLYLHHGELRVLELLSLVRHAAVVVGGVGWVVPAAIASQTPLYCVLGGQGGHNAPERITDPSTMNLSRIGWAIPDQFCRCSLKTHSCSKHITGFEEGFKTWLHQQCL